MKKIWQKILGVFEGKKETRQPEKGQELIGKMIEKFISSPETFTLYRGEGGRQSNENGLHFTTDKEWAKRFGNTILSGTLPKGSVIHLINKDDFTEALEIYSQIKTMDEATILKSQIERHNYDAMVGHDTMNCNIIDVVVNPKNLKYFKPLNLD
jgi:hypothetical protein